MDFLCLPKRKDNAGKMGETYLEHDAGSTFSGIILPDSCLMGCIGTIPGAVVPANMTALSFLAIHSYSLLLHPFFILNPARQTGSGVSRALPAGHTPSWLSRW
jgi:hypothetical protein